MIQNFHVGRNDGNFRATQHQFRINFNWSTNVRPCQSNFLSFGFDFIPFDDILAKKVPEEYLIGKYSIKNHVSYLLAKIFRSLNLMLI